VIDEFLPRFDVESSHSTRVGAPAELVYQRAWELDLSRSGLVRVLFAARGLPSSALNRAGLGKLHFKVLRKEPGVGFVLGIVGRFWMPTGGLVDFDPERFVDLVIPGYAKAVWSFGLTPGDADTTCLETVTRVQCLDGSARLMFRLYWLIVGPFSGLIRAEVLRVLRVAAEEDVGCRPA
jgi:hypothetical protein